MTENKLSKTQFNLLKQLQGIDNPEIITYRPVRGANSRAFVKQNHSIKVILPTVLALFNLNMVYRVESTRHRNEYSYFLTEKGKSYGN